MRSVLNFLCPNPDVESPSYDYRRDSAELTLLAHMVYQAVVDSMMAIGAYNLADKIDAINWIRSDSKAPWSFLWCLLNLYDFDDEVTEKVASRIREHVTGTSGHFLRLHRVN